MPVLLFQVQLELILDVLQSSPFLLLQFLRFVYSYFGVPLELIQIYSLVFRGNH